MIHMAARVFLSSTFLLMLTTGAFGADNCTEAKVGKCFTVHGRYAIYAENNGIWVIGTKRLLSTGGDDQLDDMIVSRGNWLDYAIVGDFTMCPLTRYERGHKQSVCVQSYKNVRVTKRR